MPVYPGALKLLGFSITVVQLPFPILSRFCVHQRDVLVARMIIHAYNHHVRLLSPEPLVVNNHSLLGSKEPALLCNHYGRVTSTRVLGPTTSAATLLHPEPIAYLRRLSLFVLASTSGAALILARCTADNPPDVVTQSRPDIDIQVGRNKLIRLVGRNLGISTFSLDIAEE